MTRRTRLNGNCDVVTNHWKEAHNLEVAALDSGRSQQNRCVCAPVIGCLLFFVSVTFNVNRLVTPCNVRSPVTLAVDSPVRSTFVETKLHFRKAVRFQEIAAPNRVRPAGIECVDARRIDANLEPSIFGLIFVDRKLPLNLSEDPSTDREAQMIQRVHDRNVGCVRLKVSAEPEADEQ